jgi:hypothetical protein
MDQVYAQVVERINSQAEGDAALGRMVLSELLVARGPTTIATLLDVVAARDTTWERTSDPIRMEKQIDWCLQCCGGLAVCHNGNVSLIHLTTRQYLERYGVLSGS